MDAAEYRAHKLRMLKPFLQKHVTIKASYSRKSFIFVLVKHISMIQDTLQAQAAHAVNLALTARN